MIHLKRSMKRSQAPFGTNDEDGFMKSIYNTGLIVLMSMAAGCNTKLKDCQSLKADDPKILEFANRYVNTWGSSDLATFEQPKVKEYPDHWRVFYQDKAEADGSRVLDRHFSVAIDKKTCKGSM